MQIIPITGFPLVKEGDSIPNLVVQFLSRFEREQLDGSILIITHKIISIAEGKIYAEKDIEISDRARQIAMRTSKDVVRIEIALRESSEVVRDTGVLLTRTQHGLITDYSGVDRSNAPDGILLALPNDPDFSANEIHNALRDSFNLHVPVIITDTQGRPWRTGAVNLAIGVAGMSPFIENKGKQDLYGRELQSSLVCIADELASAAELVMGQSGEGVPLVLVLRVKVNHLESSARDILRTDDQNLFL